MVEQKLVVTCNACGSKDVLFTENFEVVEMRRVSDFCLDHTWYEPSKVRHVLKCHCNKCDNDFKEDLGTEYIPLSSGNIKV